MNWSSLRNLMVSGQERFIIVENDTPEFVILSLQEYQRLVRETSQHMQGVNDQLQGMMQDNSDQDAMSASLPLGAIHRSARDPQESMGLQDLPL